MLLPNLLLKCGMFRSPFWSYSFTQFFFFSNVLEKFVLLFFSGYGFANFFHWPRAQKFSSQILALWNAAIFVVCDIIWLQRNKWIFEGFSLTFSIVKAPLAISWMIRPLLRTLALREVSLNQYLLRKSYRILFGMAALGVIFMGLLWVRGIRGLWHHL